MTISRKGVISVLAGLVFLACISLASAAPESFEINNVLIKLSLHAGETSDKVISISSPSGGEFTLSLEGAVGARLDLTEFSLSAGESRDVHVTFDPRTLPPGVHMGGLRIASVDDSRVVPIVLELESIDPLFDVNVDIPPQYKELMPSGKLISQIKIFDLTSGGTSAGLGNTHVGLDYFIYSLDGREISSQSEDAVVDRQTQLTKSFSFPSDLVPADYILAIVVKYNNSLASTTSLFTIIPEEKKGLFSGLSIQPIFIYLLIGILLFFLLFFGLFIYFVRDRDKLLLELRSYHDSEIKQLRQFLVAQEHMLNRKHGVPVAVRHEVHKKLADLKKRHAQREKEFKSLNRAGNVTEMKRKLLQWKHAGYNTTLLEYKLKGLPSKDLSSLLSQWKRKYRGEGYKNKQ